MTTAVASSSSGTGRSGHLRSHLATSASIRRLARREDDAEGALRLPSMILPNGRGLSRSGSSGPLGTSLILALVIDRRNYSLYIRLVHPSAVRKT